MDQKRGLKCLKMHIERPSETHAGIVPWRYEERHCLECKKDSAPRSDRLMFDQSVTLKISESAG
jgi:hypothetical protein